MERFLVRTMRRTLWNLALLPLLFAQGERGAPIEVDPVAGYSSAEAKIDFLGGCRLRGQELSCWDAKGEANPGLAAKANDEFKRRLFSMRVEYGREEVLLYFNAPYGEVDFELNATAVLPNNRFSSDVEGKVFPHRLQVQLPLRAEETSLKVSIREKPQMGPKVRIFKGARFSFAGIDWRIAAIGTEPYAGFNGRRWAIALKTSARLEGYIQWNAFDADGVRIIDVVEGKPVFKTDPTLRFQTGGVGTAQASDDEVLLDSSIDPRYIGFLQPTSVKSTSLRFVHLPVRPK